MGNWSYIYWNACITEERHTCWPRNLCHRKQPTRRRRTLKRLASRSKLTETLLKQAKLQSFRVSSRYKYGFEVPKSYNNAKWLDKKNGNTRYIDSNKLEHKQLEEYDVFIDKGKFKGCKITRDFRLIRVHTIFDIKIDGRHKSRVVIDGYLTSIPTKSVYSGVISLQGLHTCIFIG